MEYISSITINIEGNEIGEKGAASIKEALKINAALTKLNTRNNINGIYTLYNYNHSVESTRRERRSINSRSIQEECNVHYIR